MNRRANIAGRIERNRIALLRLVFCWLTTAYLFSSQADRVLPRRMAALADLLIGKAEKAVAYLIIASCYHGQIRVLRSIEFQRNVLCQLCHNRALTAHRMTVSTIIARLKALQKTLNHLHATARRIAKAERARQLVAALAKSAGTETIDAITGTALVPSRVPMRIPP